MQCFSSCIGKHATLSHIDILNVNALVFFFISEMAQTGRKYKFSKHNLNEKRKEKNRQCFISSRVIVCAASFLRVFDG